MQANEFEKKIRNQMEEFELTPDGEVWMKVAARIDEQKKRRRFVFFWFFIGFLLFGATAAWWLTHKESKLETATVSAVAPPGTPSYKKPIVEKVRVQNAVEDFVSVTKKTAKKVSPGDVNTGNKAGKNEMKNNDAVRIFQRELVQIPNNYTRVLAIKEKDDRQLMKQDQSGAGVIQPDNKVLESSHEIAAVLESSPITPSAVSADTLAAINKTAAPKDTSLSTITGGKTAPNQLIQKTGKWTFGFTAFAGLSDNRSGFPITTTSRSLYDAAFLSAQYNGGQYSYTSTLDYSSAFSYGFGAFTVFHVSRKVAVSAGLDYQYFSANSLTGTKTTASATAIYDSSLNKSVALDEFYSDGASVTFTNKYHLLQLPVNLVFQVNKSQSKPVVLTAGISPAILTGSYALYANQSERVYYVEKEQFRRFQLFAQAGLLFTFINAKTYQINAGPAIKYGISNLVKPVISTRQHLFFTGLQFNISLK